MRVLIDTQVLLWWLDGDARLGKRAISDLSAADTEVFVSSLSIFECAVKERANKLKVSTIAIVKRLESEKFMELPFDHWSAQKLIALPELSWKDPFDMALLAQSAAKRLWLMTADENLKRTAWEEARVIDALV